MTFSTGKALVYALLLGTLAVAAPAFSGKKSGLPEVPQSVPEPEHSRLEKLRDELSQIKTGLNARIDKQNVECSSVPEDSPKNAPCQEEQERLQQASDDYAAKKKAYLQQITEAKESVPMSGVLGTVGDARGEFYIQTADGKRISGAQALKAPLGAG